MDAGTWIAIYAALLSTALGIAQLLSSRREHQRQRELERRDYRTDLELQAEVQLVYVGGQLFKPVAETVAAHVSLRVENVSRQEVVLLAALATLDFGDLPPVTGVLKTTEGDGRVELPPARVASLVGDLALDWPGTRDRFGGGSPMGKPMADHGLRSLYISVMTPEREFKLQQDVPEYVLAAWGGPSTAA